MENNQDPLQILLHNDLYNPVKRVECFEIITNQIKVICEYLDIKNIEYNSYILLDLIVHFQEDMKKYDNPNVYKIAGCLCFWIRKLKPFRKIDKLNFYTNEIFGLLTGSFFVASVHGSKTIPEDLFHNMLYDLRYGVVSYSVIANQFNLLHVS